MTEQPTGYAAVPDPDDPQRMTYWALFDTCTIRDYPHGARWRPIAPPLPGVVGEERRQRRQEWYQDHYFPWRDKVRQAIEADPAGARARFLREYPEPGWTGRPVRPKAPPRPARTRPTEAEEYMTTVTGQAHALLAAALRLGGHTHAAVAKALNVSEATARRRAKYGELLADMHRIKAHHQQEQLERRDAALDALADHLAAGHGSERVAAILRDLIATRHTSRPNENPAGTDPAVTVSARNPEPPPDGP